MISRQNSGQFDSAFLGHSPGPKACWRAAGPHTHSPVTQYRTDEPSSTSRACSVSFTVSRASRTRIPTSQARIPRTKSSTGVLSPRREKSLWRLRRHRPFVVCFLSGSKPVPLLPQERFLACSLMELYTSPSSQTPQHDSSSAPTASPWTTEARILLLPSLIGRGPEWQIAPGAVRAGGLPRRQKRHRHRRWLTVKRHRHRRRLTVKRHRHQRRLTVKRHRHQRRLTVERHRHRRRLTVKRHRHQRRLTVKRHRHQRRLTMAAPSPTEFNGENHRLRVHLYRVESAVEDGS